MPIKDLFNFLAAKATVPEPENGSKIISPKVD